MSVGIFKNIVRLCEQRKIDISPLEYSDIIHGRTPDRRHHFDIEEMPIAAATTKWKHIDYNEGSKLERTFKFVNSKTLKYFIDEALKHQFKTNHHCVMVVDELIVKISLQTKDVKEVTELDIELGQHIDEIYKDTQYFYPAK